MPAQIACKRSAKKRMEVLLSPPGVFGGIETGQVFVLFDDIHLFRGPTRTEEKLKNTVGDLISRQE